MILALCKYIPHSSRFLAPFARLTRVFNALFNPKYYPTPSMLMIRLPMPTPASFTGSLSYPIAIIFIVSTTKQKIQPKAAGMA